MYSNKGDIPPKNYQDRYIQLKLLGYPSYSSYLESPYWKIIRKEVFSRDFFTCISGYVCKGSKKDELQVHHVNYARSVMLGINLGCLVTLCRSCHEYCEISTGGLKYSLQETQQRFFSLILRVKRVGVSNPLVGKWYKKMYLASRFHSQNVLRLYQEQKLPWYELIVDEIGCNKLPWIFAKYLDLTGDNMRLKTRYRPIDGRKAFMEYLAEERRLNRLKQEGLDQAAKQASEALEGFTKRLQKRKKFWKQD